MICWLWICSSNAAPRGFERRPTAYSTNAVRYEGEKYPDGLDHTGWARPVNSPLHPHELPGVGDGLLLGLGHVAALQVAPVLGAALVARLGGHAVVVLPDLLGRVDGGGERDVRISLLRGPHHRLLAQHARDPHARVRLLERHRPRVHHALLVVRALPAERPGLGPRANDEIVGLLEALAVVGGVHAGRELLLRRRPARSPRRAGHARPCRSSPAPRRGGRDPRRGAAGCRGARSSRAG